MAPIIKALIVAPLLVLTAACGVDSSRSAQTALTDGHPAQVAVTGEVVASGTFSGRNNHVVGGLVEVIEQDGSLFLRLGEDFSLDGAPDPRIGFGRAGTYDTSTTFTVLERDEGQQTYALPAGFELGTLDEATIWCEDFSVALGTAPLR